MALLGKSVFDLIVVGAGPGGSTAARLAAGLGLRTALVEQTARPGGTSVWHGCLPVAAWRQQAAIMRSAEAAAGRAGPDWSAVQVATAAAMAQASRQVQQQLAAAGVTVLAAAAQLDGPGRVRLLGEGVPEVLQGQRIILATGSIPAGLPGVTLDGRHLLNSDHLLAAAAVPTSLVVVGAGRVGTELAGLMQGFGSAVTLVEVEEQLVPGQDDECAAALQATLMREGVEVHTGTRVRGIEGDGDGVRCLLDGRTGGSRTEMRTSALLAATGRRPRTGDLGLETVDVVLDRRGRIQVDSAMQTATAGLYAIGDIVPTLRLADVACREAVVAVEHASGREVTPVRYQRTPFMVRGACDLVSIGQTARAAREAGHLVRCGRWQLERSGLAGLVKVVVDAESGRLLGVHLVGPQVSSLVPAAAAALGWTSDRPEWFSAELSNGTPDEALTLALSAAIVAATGEVDNAG